MLDADTLENAAIWRPGAPDGLGDVHVGRVTARIPAMAGAFVTLVDAEGFLPDSAGGAGLSEGMPVGVTITRTAQGGKGPRLARATVAADGPVRLIARGPTPLDRLATAYPQAEIQVDDLALFASLRPTYPNRIAKVAIAFDDSLEARFESLGSPRAELPGGLVATITPTPALVAIDIDGGASTAERGGKQAVQFAANRAALPALAREIRLRNLSGAILVDLAGVSAKRRAGLGPDLSAALADDPARPRLLGFTALGLAEILRPRTGPPLHELLAGPHAAGLSALRQVARQPLPRLRLRAAPAVIACLRRDTEALADLARRVTYPLMLKEDANLAISAWMIEDAS